MNCKILHIINGEFYSGAERVQDLLASNLINYGYEVYFACIKPKRFRTYSSYFSKNIFDFQMNSQFDLSVVLSITQFVKKNHISLIHTHTPRSALIGAFVSTITKIPFVHHLHSPTSNDTENSLRNYINSTIERFVIKKALKVIVVSNSLKKYAIKELKCNSDLVEVILNGVPIVPIDYSLSIQNKRIITIGIIALFRPRKGLEILLEAISLVVKRGYSIKLRAIGIFETEMYKSLITKLIDNLELNDHVEWVGFSDNINFELTKIDILVLPSLYGEGLPMVILEAMANGVPVIATNIEGIKDAIPTDNYGLVVDPGCPEMIAMKIIYLMTHHETWASIRKQAHKRQNETLSDVNMSIKLSKIYDRILINE
ncbi:MAG: glycosyltransferase [Methylicorpusculum sp.]|uniref:glycosyltransferase n=1 Tax=Methylicorpusculum sp. TaxID=2713644 RepID=UPI00272FD279|nr:glycosyltransferase [Methylicorpusculum sp.]MDP2180849.1 glycosyltransferase [Methylicorpusculum sp.]